jgi:hypothetical protein
MNSQRFKRKRQWLGRAIAQAVNRPVTIAAARVRAQVKSCRTRGRESGNRAGSLRVLRFPLPIPIPPAAPHSSFGAGTTGQLVADVIKRTQVPPPPEVIKQKSAVACFKYHLSFLEQQRTTTKNTSVKMVAIRNEN